MNRLYSWLFFISVILSNSAISQTVRLKGESTMEIIEKFQKKLIDEEFSHRVTFDRYAIFNTKKLTTGEDWGWKNISISDTIVIIFQHIDSSYYELAYAYNTLAEWCRIENTNMKYRVSLGMKSSPDVRYVYSLFNKNIRNFKLKRKMINKQISYKTDVMILIKMRKYKEHIKYYKCIHYTFGS